MEALLPAGGSLNVEKPISQMSDAEFRQYLDRTLRERERARARATGEAVADLIEGTPVVRELATVACSVWSVFRL